MVRRALVLFALSVASFGLVVSADQASATNKPGSLALTIVGENGRPVDDARVVAHGAADRAGTSGADGLVTLVNLPPGNYRLRITRDGFYTLDKEITIRAGVRLTAEGVLSAAPPPPPVPTPTPTPTPTTKPASTTELKPGPPYAGSIIDLVDSLQASLKTSPTVEKDLGCSGGSASRVIMTRENITSHTHSDADEMIYVVAGEAALSLGGKEQPVSAGWFTVVPRGTAHALTRRGRNALLVLSVRSGPPCPGL